MAVGLLLLDMATKKQKMLWKQPELLLLQYQESAAMAALDMLGGGHLQRQRLASSSAATS